MVTSLLRMALNVEPIGESIFYHNRGNNFREGNNNFAAPTMGDPSKNNAPVAAVTFPVVPLPPNGIKVKAKRDSLDKNKREFPENQKCSSMCFSFRIE